MLLIKLWDAHQTRALPLRELICRQPAYLVLTAALTLLLMFGGLAAAAHGASLLLRGSGSSGGGGGVGGDDQGCLQRLQRLRSLNEGLRRINKEVGAENAGLHERLAGHHDDSWDLAKQEEAIKMRKQVRERGPAAPPSAPPLAPPAACRSFTER